MTGGQEAAVLGLEGLEAVAQNDLGALDAHILVQDLALQTKNVAGDHLNVIVLITIAHEVRVEVHPGQQQDQMINVMTLAKEVRENLQSNTKNKVSVCRIF